MSLEVIGKLHKVFDTQQKTEKFSMREFILEIEDGNYPQLIKFQLMNDGCHIVDGFECGEKIKVSFNLKGKEWNEKFFTNLNAWQVNRV